MNFLSRHPYAYSIDVWRYEDNTEISGANKRWDHGHGKAKPANGKCGYLYGHNGRWRDASCNEKKYFLCEKQGEEKLSHWSLPLVLGSKDDHNSNMRQIEC